jgi:hypothetical protein
MRFMQKVSKVQAGMAEDNLVEDVVAKVVAKGGRGVGTKVEDPTLESMLEVAAARKTRLLDCVPE